MAARWDQAVDYRTSIALANLYPRHHLFIVDDNHVFTKLDENGVRSRLIQAFMKFGLNNPQFKSVLEASKAHRWTD